MRIDGDRVREFQPAIAHGRLVRQKHAAAVCSIRVEPHPLPIGYNPQFADRIDRARVRGSENANDTHRSYAAPAIFGNCGFERIQTHAKLGVGGQGTQCRPAQAYGVQRLINRDVAFFRRVHSPAFLKSVLLCPIPGSPVPRQLQPNEIRHHTAAGKISARFLAVTDKVGEPANRPALHRDCRRANRISSNILIKS